MTLVRAADAAYPGVLSSLPADVPVVLGYAGEAGHTPHVWAPLEVEAVRASGRHWWPIIVPPQGLLTTAIGSAAAAAMLAVLPSYGVGKDDPVIIDIETTSWSAGMPRSLRVQRLEALWAAQSAGAMAAITAFKTDIKAAGYTRPLAYVPAVAGFDWIANWTGTAPSSLPAGVVGQQYESTAAWDYSMFDASLLSTPAPPAPPKPPAPTPTPTPTPTPQPEDPLSGMIIWWFGRTVSDGKVWAINSLTGQYFHVLNEHNGKVFAQWLDNNNVPYTGTVDKPQTIEGAVSQFGVEMVPPAAAS